MPDEPRDYLAEAHAIIRGETMLLPQVEHLHALQIEQLGNLKALNKEIEELKTALKDQYR